MSSPENVRVIEKLFEDEGKGDLDSVVAAFSDTATLELAKGTMFAGVHTGREEIRQAFALVGRVFPTGIQLSEAKLNSDENRVFAELAWTATSFRGDQVEDREIFVFNLEDRKVTSARAFTMGAEAAAIGDLQPSDVPTG